MTYSVKPLGSFPAIVQPNTRVSNRSDIYDDQEETSDADAERMNALMQQLMGNSMEIEEEEEESNGEQEMSAVADDENDEPKENEDEDELQGFSFKLFSSKQVTKISLQGVDRGDEMSAEVARQQVVDHDEEDPEFAALVAASAVSYDQIMEQSRQSYGLAQSTHVMNIPLADEPKLKRKKRKSKQCREYNRAVKAGTIQPEPRMRNPQVPNGWPGWPGIRTCFAIITKFSKDLKCNQRVVKPYVPRESTRGRGSARERGSTRGRGSARERGSTRGSGSGRGRGGGEGRGGRGRGANAQSVGRVSSSTSAAPPTTPPTTAPTAPTST
ncbi:hypothetical protein CLU79DRAFT_774758 [Phycomyces nitens]|nr:hypothetical protein CLU79DRAFT_774758 [Phycomyces nitens]